MKRELDKEILEKISGGILPPDDSPRGIYTWEDVNETVNNRPCPCCGGKLEYNICIDVVGLLYHCNHCGKFFWETEKGVLEESGISPVINN